VKEQLAKLFEQLVLPAFRFSYSLTCNEQKSKQLVIDAWAVLLIRREEEFHKRYTVLGKDPSYFDKEEIEGYLFSEIWGIVVRRKEMVGQADLSPFFQLSVERRGIISLHHSLGWDLSRIGNTLGFDHTTVCEFLNGARMQLGKYGHTNPSAHSNKKSKLESGDVTPKSSGSGCPLRNKVQLISEQHRYGRQYDSGSHDWLHGHLDLCSSCNQLYHSINTIFEQIDQLLPVVKLTVADINEISMQANKVLADTKIRGAGLVRDTICRLLTIFIQLVRLS
jgi:hypothetical protein